MPTSLENIETIFGMTEDQYLETQALLMELAKEEEQAPKKEEEEEEEEAVELPF